MSCQRRSEVSFLCVHLHNQGGGSGWGRAQSWGQDSSWHWGMAPVPVHNCSDLDDSNLQCLAGLVPYWACHQPEGNIKITSQAKASQEEHEDGQCFARGKAECQGQSSEQLHNFSNSG